MATTTITTNPSPVKINNPAILTYINTSKITFTGEEFQLKNQSGTPVSDIFTSTAPVQTVLSTNISPTYATASAYCLYSSNGKIYTSMEKSNIPGNGFIQITDTNGVSSDYLQFNNNATPPIPSNFRSPQYPTSLAFDSNGYLYFLVYGDNNIYKINNINNPYSSYVQYNTTTSVVSAPFDMEINLDTNYIYVTATNPPYRIQQIDTNGVTSVLPNSTGTGSSFGICADSNNNLYIGYANGVIGKYNLNTNTFTQNFYTIPTEGKVYGLSFVKSQNVILANTSTTNIYLITLESTPRSIKIISNSGILGGFSNDNKNSIYGTTQTNIVKYDFNQTLTFNNLVLTNSGINNLNIYNNTLSNIYDNINVFATDYVNYNYQNNSLTSLFQPLIYGTQYPNKTGYTYNGKDLNEIFANISSGTSLGYNVLYKTGSQDLSQIFAKYNPPS